LKRKALILLFILSSVWISPLYAKSKNFSSKKSKPIVFVEAPLKVLTVGERLVFDVSWMGVPVGVGTLEVKEIATIRDRRAYHVVAIAKTNDFLSRFYPIHDEVHSFIDAEKFYSLEFSKVIQEGRYRADEKMTYDYKKRKIFYESLWNKSKKEFDLPSEVQDFLSALYWFRVQPVVVGKSLHTVVNSEAENWDLELDILRQETKEFKDGRAIPTILVEPKTRLKGMLYRRGRVWVYFSADQKRLPVWVTLRTPFGPVNGVLRD